MRFHHRLEQHKLAEQILATVNELLTRKGLTAQSRHSRRCHLDCSAHRDQKRTKPKTARCIRARRAKQRYFGMKAHIGVDADSGLVHTARGSSSNVADITQANNLLHGQEQMVFADAG